MRNTLRFTLYLACGEKPLHVNPNQCTDLWRNVKTLLSRGLIEQVQGSAPGKYYVATNEGRRIHIMDRWHLLTPDLKLSPKYQAALPKSRGTP